MLTLWPSNSTPRYMPKGNECILFTKRGGRPGKSSQHQLEFCLRRWVGAPWAARHWEEHDSHGDKNELFGNDDGSKQLKHKGERPSETQSWSGRQDLEERAKQSVMPRDTVRFGFRNYIQKGVWDVAKEANQGGAQRGNSHFAAILPILKNNCFSYTQPAILTLVCCFNW